MLRVLATVTMLSVLLAMFSPVAAAGYPRRPVTLIVPFPPGGATDIVGRGIAEAVRKHLPQPVAVVNRAGGAGTVGVSEVVLARPDGYTIGLGAVAILTVQPYLSALPYKNPGDITPILKLVNLPIVLFVRSDAPWKTASELLEYARANPGKLRVGVPGIGTILHLNLEQLKLLAQVDMVVVPFEGPRQVAALLGGHVDLALAHPAAIMGYVEAGRIRVIGVFQPQRNSRFPQAQTFKELGYDITRGVYYFLFAPKNTPRTIIVVLHDAFKKALAEPTFVDLARKADFEIDYQPPGALTRELWASFEEYGRLVEYLGLKK